jgi:hypothetical protein
MRRCYLATLCLILTPALGHAHAIGVDCKLRAGKIEVEAFYDDDSPAGKAKVRVVNAKEEIIASGVTDAKGLWSFAAPASGKYEVRVDAGAGHRAKKAIEVPADPEVIASEGPTRAEFTSTPWLKMLIGVAVIGGLGGAFLLMTAFRRNRQVVKAKQG